MLITYEQPAAYFFVLCAGCAGAWASSGSGSGSARTSADGCAPSDFFAATAILRSRAILFLSRRACAWSAKVFSSAFSFFA